MTSDTAKAPRHLKAATRRWWEKVVAAYELEAHHLRTLELACDAWDEYQAARAALAKHGLTYTDKNDCPRPRPEVAIARDNRIAFARLVRELSLDIDPPAESRPPRLMGTGAG